MINEWVYCPRLFWLEYVDRSFADSHDTVDGQRVHRNVDAPTNAPMPDNGGEPLTLRSISLSSERHGIVGTIDVVDVSADEVVPIDYKRGRVPNTPGGAYLPERVQLCLQGLLLREAGYRCNRGFLYFAGSRKRVEVVFDDALLETATAAIEQARVASAQPIPPPLIDSPKCPRCSLVGICLPDETANLQGRLARADVRPLVVPLDEPAPLYVTAPGASVGKDYEVLQIRKDGAVVDEVRLIDVSHVSVFGNVQVSTQALRELFGRHIPVFYFSFGAWLAGMSVAPVGHSIDARIAQYRVAQDDSASLAIARAIVEGKIRNQRTLVRRSLTDDAKRDLAFLAFSIRQSRRARTANDLLGIEGMAARTYFSCFARMLKRRDEFSFNDRNRRPPRDPVNATLSFLYALLVRDCVAALLAVGLEPGLGVFHRVRLGRPSLALDLAEEFRPLIADSVALSALNTGELSPDHFVQRGAGVALTDAGRRAVIGAYERRMASTIVHELFGYTASYRRILAIQARLLARCLEGDISQYPPFVTR
jgi:CRISPR-associated protein Cas1